MAGIEHRLMYLDGPRWALIMALLSMDLTAPFYEQMGLKVQSARLLPILRRSILDVGAGSGLSALTRQVARVLGVISKEMGEDVGRELLHWGRFIFCQSDADHPDLSLWTKVLRQLNDRPPARNEGLQWAGSRLGFLAYLQARPNELPLQTQLLSSWDLCIYLVGGFAYADPEAQNQPTFWIQETVRAYQGRTFWSKLLTQSTAAELDRLQQEGTRAAHEAELLSASELLAHPSLLGWRHG